MTYLQKQSVTIKLFQFKTFPPVFNKLESLHDEIKNISKLFSNSLD